MRKYFLLSAVALLATSTANATTDYAEVTAKATVDIANEITCTPWDFGHLILKPNRTGTIRLDYGLGGGDTNDQWVVSKTGGSRAVCTYNFEWDNLDNGSFGVTSGNEAGKIVDYATLKNENDDVMYIRDIRYYPENNTISLEGALEIDEDAGAGTYNGSFTISFIY